MKSRGLTTAAESAAFASPERWAVRFRDQAVTFLQLRRVNRNRVHPGMSDPLGSTMIVNLYAIAFVIVIGRKTCGKYKTFLQTVPYNLDYLSDRLRLFILKMFIIYSTRVI